jgi:hypothetical protein
VASAPKRRSHADPRPPLPASIQDEIRLKNRLRRQWQVTRDSALKAQVSRFQCSVPYRLNEWRNEQWSDKLESLDSENQSLWKMTKRMMRVPTPLPPFQVPGVLDLSDCEKAEAVADSRLAQFQPVNDPSDPAVIEMVNEAMCVYEYAPASEPKLTSPSAVLQAIRGLKVGKDSGPNRVVRHLPKRAITFLRKVFNGVLRRRYFPSAWKHARMASIQKPTKDPTLPSSYSVSQPVVRIPLEVRERNVGGMRAQLKCLNYFHVLQLFFLCFLHPKIPSPARLLVCYQLANLGQNREILSFGCRRLT